MSTTNNCNKDSNTAPWNDWKLDSKFLSEVIKYCEDHNQTFSGLADSLIMKAEKGVKLLRDVLVSLFHSFY